MNPTISILKRAFDIVIEKKLSNSAWLLYSLIFLKWCANREDWVKISQEEVMETTGFCWHTLIDCRKALVKEGLIEYKRGWNGRHPSYRLLDMKEVE